MKRRYTLSYSDDTTGERVTMEVSAGLCLSDYMEHFTAFLQATGFTYLAELDFTTWPDKLEQEAEDEAKSRAVERAAEDCD